MIHPSRLHPTQPIKLYRYPLSGHSHRVELFLSLLSLPVELIDVDLAAGAQKTPMFLEMNPFGQVPVIQDGSLMIADSNAILVYLASQYANEQWLPHEPARAAEVQRWLSVAAGPVAYGPAVARLITLFNAPFNAEEVVSRAQDLFAVMEKALQKALFLAGDQPTIADIANYTYIAHAPEGNISLASYPHLRNWLARIEGLPGFIPMVKSAVGLAA